MRGTEGRTLPAPGRQCGVGALVPFLTRTREEGEYLPTPRCLWRIAVRLDARRDCDAFTHRPNPTAALLPKKQMSYQVYENPSGFFSPSLLGPQSRFGDRLLGIKVVCPQKTGLRF